MKVKFEDVKLVDNQYHITADVDGVKHLHVLYPTSVVSIAERDGITDANALDVLLQTPHGPDAQVEKLSDEYRAVIMEGVGHVRQVQQAGLRSLGRIDRSDPGTEGGAGRRSFLGGVADNTRSVPSRSIRRVGARKRFANQGTGGAGDQGSEHRPEGDGNAPPWII